ncbi:MAG: hypothetical protein JSV31_23355 [Desulfobacterales bacterium]|nr:MAG: hypothetical protein JSV31_23355 [Desulfobacterales bacterium]
MVNSMVKASVSLLYMVIIVSFIVAQNTLARAEDGPIINIDPTIYTFPPVFEGETLSHDFKVLNKGSADLEIKDVTHQ